MINRTIEDAALAMLIQAYLTTCLWPYAVKHVIFIRNRVPHSATNVPPYLFMHGARPSLKYARVVGHISYLLKLPYNSKFDDRGVKGVLLEVLDHSICKVLFKNMEVKLIISESRHFTFDEARFLGAPDLDVCMNEDAPDDESWEAYSTSGESIDAISELMNSMSSMYDDGNDRVARLEQDHIV